jgi:hypothetical protein
VEYSDVSVLRTDNGLAPSVEATEATDCRSAFLTAPDTNVDAALQRAENEKKRVLVFVFDPLQQHSFHLKATVSSPETRKLVDENFIVVFTSDPEEKHVFGLVDDISPAHPAWVLFKPDGTMVEQGDAAMGTERGLKWIQRLIEIEHAGVNGGAPVSASQPVGRPVDARSLAKVEVQDAEVLKLAADAKIWSDRDVQITTIPPAFAGLQFTQHKAHALNLKFKVRTDGMVYMGCSARWGGTAAPEVAKTLVTAEQLEKEGWVREEPYEIATTARDMTFLIFSRSCKAGEEFNYRTEKYAPPILLIK